MSGGKSPAFLQFSWRDAYFRLSYEKSIGCGFDLLAAFAGAEAVDATSDVGRASGYVTGVLRHCRGVVTQFCHPVLSPPVWSPVSSHNRSRSGNVGERRRRKKRRPLTVALPSPNVSMRSPASDQTRQGVRSNSSQDVHRMPLAAGPALGWRRAPLPTRGRVPTPQRGMGRECEHPVGRRWQGVRSASEKRWKNQWSSSLPGTMTSRCRCFDGGPTVSTRTRPATSRRSIARTNALRLKPSAFGCFSNAVGA
jgi:hypothetical protein